MLINQRCTTCGETVTEAEITQCDTCGDHLHTGCEDFETEYECPTCGDEPWVGALEF
jgi:predicted RNA-binding Zn-ribbon protein involved in translation (DUF1610 family)